MKKIDKRELFSKLVFFSRDKETLLNRLVDHLNSGKKLQLVFTPNPEQLVQAQNDANFFANLQQADYLLPDGVGLVWALKYLSNQAAYKTLQPPQERIAGVEVVEALLNLANTQDWKILLIGGKGYQAYLAKQKFAWLKNFLWLEAYQQVKAPQVDEEAELVEKITDFKPDLVFVAFGAPDQEEWLIGHKEFLDKTKAKLAMAVGGSFDMILGKLGRAPLWMRKLNLEWLFRLIIQPWRLKRQLRLLKFLGLILQKN